MPSPAMRRSTPVAVIAAAALLLAGCGASGGNASSSGTAKTDTKTTSATTAGGGSTKDSTTTTEARAVTATDLKAILPTAEDVGPDYTLDEITTNDGSDSSTTTEPDATDKAMQEACPELAALDFGGTGSGSDEVTASFKTKDDRGIEVGLDPTPQGLDEKDIDKIVDAFNGCKELKINEQGTDMTMNLKAEKLEDIGDYGIDVTFDLSFQMMGTDIGLQFHGYIFVVDDIGVSVLATSGLDPETMKPSPADEDLIEPLSVEMEKRVKAL